MTAAALERAATPAAGYDEVIIRVRRYRGRAGVEICTTDTPDYVVLANGPVQIASAIEQVWCEHAIATYASRRGEVYDRALHDETAARLAQQGRQLREGQIVVLTPAVDRRLAGTVRRASRVHDVQLWRPLPTGTVELRSGKVVKNVAAGSWESPAGRVYLSGARIVAAVIRKREHLGLPVVP